MIIVHYMIKGAIMHGKQALNTYNICKNLYNHHHFTWIFCQIYTITAIVLKFSVEVNILYKTLQPLNLCIIMIIFCDNLSFLLYCEYYALLNLYIL